MQTWACFTESCKSHAYLGTDFIYMFYQSNNTPLCNACTIVLLMWMYIMLHNKACVHTHTHTETHTHTHAHAPTQTHTHIHRASLAPFAGQLCSFLFYLLNLCTAQNSRPVSTFCTQFPQTLESLLKRTAVPRKRRGGRGAKEGET